MSPTRVVVDDDEQQLADLEADLRRLRSRLATTAVTGTHDEFTAAATPSTTYTLTYIPLTGTCLMALNGHVQREGVDYTVAYDTGVVTVSATQASGDKITFRYLVTDWLIARSLIADTGINGIYAIGGFTGNGTARYDLPAGTWTTTLTNFPAPAQTHDFAIGTINGKIYVAGGYSGAGVVQTACREYDPATDTWTTKTAMPTGTQDCGYAVLNNKLYVIGGNQAPTGLTTVQVYDPATDTWTTAASLPATWDDMVCGTISGKIYAASGLTPAGTTQTGQCYQYDPGTNAWTAKASMSAPVHAAFGAACGGKLYVVSGETQSFGPVVRTSAVQVYDPVGNSWSSAASLPTPARSNAAACEANGYLYVSGGDTGTAQASLYRYDPTSNTWTTLTSDPGGGIYGHGMSAAL